MNNGGLRTPIEGSKAIICPQCNFKIDDIPLRILKPKLLIVEGRNDERFFCALIEHLRIGDIQVAGIGGKDKIRINLKGLVKDPDFSKVESLGIVRDADVNPKAAFQSLRDSLKDSGLPSPKKPQTAVKGPPKVTVLIIPSYERRGELEDLCLEAIVEDPAVICVNQYFACLDQQRINPTKNLSKAKVQVFLASQEDPTLPLGISAQKGYWPLDSRAFATVKGFLKSL